jgi:hypothetical protein
MMEGVLNDLHDLRAHTTSGMTFIHLYPSREAHPGQNLGTQAWQIEDLWIDLRVRAIQNLSTAVQITAAGSIVPMYRVMSVLHPTARNLLELPTIDFLSRYHTQRLRPNSYMELRSSNQL